MLGFALGLVGITLGSSFSPPPIKKMIEAMIDRLDEKRHVQLQTRVVRGGSEVAFPANWSVCASLELVPQTCECAQFTSAYHSVSLRARAYVCMYGYV